MTGCEQLADRMPAVMAGTDQWTATDHRHLASCSECGAGWRLVQATSQLGTGLPRVDADRLAGAVLGRVRAGKARARRARWAGAGLAGLAAATLAISVLVPASPVTTGPHMVSAGPSVTLPLAELEDVSDDELRDVLAAFDPPITDGTSLDGLGALEENDMERALRAWEES